MEADRGTLFVCAAGHYRMGRWPRGAKRMALGMSEFECFHSNCHLYTTPCEDPHLLAALRLGGWKAVAALLGQAS